MCKYCFMITFPECRADAVTALCDEQVTAVRGDPKSRNDGTAEWQNHGITESRNGGKSPQILKDGIAKRRNDGKYPEILKDGMTENAPKS